MRSSYVRGRRRQAFFAERGMPVFQFRWLWKNMTKRDHVLFILGLFISVVSTVMLLINPYLSSILVDEVIVGGDTAPLLPLLFAMLGVQLLRLSLRYGMVLCFEYSTQDMLVNLQGRLFEVLQHQETAFFNRNRTGDLMTRLSGDVDWCRHFMAYLVYVGLESVLQFVSALVFFLFVNVKLALALLAVTPALFFLTRSYHRHIRPLFGQLRDRMSDMNTAAQENIAGQRVVKAFAREEYEKERFEECNAQFRDANLAINKTWLTYFPALAMMGNAMTLITIFLGGYFIITGDLTAGQLSIFTSLSWALANPVNNLGPLLNDYQRFFASANKIIEIYYSRPLIADRPDAVSHPHTEGRVEFSHVSLEIDRVPVLRDVSFRIEPGQTLAIMGPTGAGKTSVINLLARFYDPTAGKVLLDGCDVHLWKLEELRRSIGTATQDVFLFSDTVAGNIAFGDDKLTDEEIRDFARRAGAAEFVEKMPEGYDTVIGERGVGLSGGQRQRIALARAMAVRAAVLVLDDTTSALDNETEQYIQQQLRELPYPCTKIIIAQRVSSARDADRIIVLKDGEIAEEGTHEELLARRGYYYDTYALQNDLSRKDGEI